MAQGIRQNLPQFSLLILINGFVGVMAGVERSILPDLAREEFGLSSKAAIVSFLVAFGLSKALMNVMAGGMADRFGRKPTLIAGWMAALPVPLVLIFAPNWSWIVLANVLLGVNKALCWSVTVIMKIDPAGNGQRG